MNVQIQHDCVSASCSGYRVEPAKKVRGFTVGNERAGTEAQRWDLCVAYARLWVQSPVKGKKKITGSYPNTGLPIETAFEKLKFTYCLQGEHGIPGYGQAGRKGVKVSMQNNYFLS